jgi:hypothetical protein
MQTKENCCEDVFREKIGLLQRLRTLSGVLHTDQGCEMVYSQTKNHDLGKFFWRAFD